MAGFLGPFMVGYVKGATGTNSAGMYFLAAALVIGSLTTLTIPATSVKR